MPDPQDRPLRLGYCQQSILRKNRLLTAVLPEVGALVKLGLGNPKSADIDGILGWGKKPTSTQAMSLAERYGLPYYALEDGFLRSLDLGVRGGEALSFVLDRTGIYYDARHPSDLEALIARPGDPDETVRATAAIARLRAARLSKYNAAPELPADALPASDKPRILVIDQTAGDASITYGLADQASFRRMLEAARDENPGAEIIVKTHPDVAAGAKQGHLADLARKWDCRLLTQACNPWSLLEQVQGVYAVTSQMGFEAALAGLPVRCFGMPFYAGWGITQDELSCDRRTARRSVEQIFAAAYLHYSRYADPFTGQPSSFEQTVDTLALWRRINDANRQPTAAVRMQWWKRRQVGKFLGSTEGPAQFFKSEKAAITWAAARKGRVVAWATRQSPGFAQDAAAAGVPHAGMEDGFLRSVGLGADFFPAVSLVVDTQGLYFDPRQPSDLETIFAQADFTPALTTRAAALRAAIVRHGITKYNTGDTQTAVPWPTDGRLKVFVPGQVQDDLSVRYGSPEIKTNLDLLKAVRSALPDAFIVYKPHPDVDAGHRTGAIPEEVALQYADHVARGIASTSLIRDADAIHTMTSLVGFEALLRDKRVHCYGQPFYSGWGLTVDRFTIPRRKRNLTIDQLVVGALILYPRYVDPATSLPCEPELIIQRFAEGYRPPQTRLIKFRRWTGQMRMRLQEMMWRKQRGFGSPKGGRTK